MELEKSAERLARNPLGIIALFIVMVYVSGSQLCWKRNGSTRSANHRPLYRSISGARARRVYLACIYTAGEAVRTN
jgi:hypothetical protein